MSRWIHRRTPGPLLAVATGSLVAGSLLAGSLLAAAPAAGSAVPSTGAVNSATVAVIVTATPGEAKQAAQAVRSVGGSVGRSLAIVGGFSASLPVAARGRLAADASIARISEDTAVHFSNTAVNAATIASNYPKSTGATTAWAAGNYGGGVNVAVIDTGVAPVDDLATRLVAGPDFAGDRVGDPNGSLYDDYGHGTVIAGVIAGDGTDSAGQPGGGYVGMAPQAGIVSVKVAGANGATDVSTVLAAMQWVGSHQAQYNIGVVELAWGTPSDQSPAIDPLDYAVERLWKSGIVVVAAAGNSGPALGTVTKPGDDPLIITAGAYNDFQNLSTGDDAVTQWSSRGLTSAGFAKPDIVAPGRYIVAPKSPGSTIDQDNPDASVGSDYIRGSGTSQASAVVAGSVALLLNARPWLQPDQVKYALMAATLPINTPASLAEGNGRLSVPGSLAQRIGNAPAQLFAGSGLGSLEASRGGRHVNTVCTGTAQPTTIIGEMDGMCLPWDPAAWVSGAWTARAWNSNSWSSNSWSSNSWSSNSWSSNSWSSFLTAFWGKRTPWWHPLPGEAASPRPIGVVGARATP